MMFDTYGPGHFYDFDPEKHEENRKKVQENPPFATSIHIRFKSGQVTALDAASICSHFADFGDFYLTKDTPDSVYIEFAHIDPKKVPD